MILKSLGYWLVSRPRKRPPTTVVLHATAGGSALSSASWLKKIGLSYHYVIERDGTIYKCTQAGRVAFHAGESYGPEGANVNEYSIGIAFAHSNEPGEPYTDAAVAACKALIAELRGQFPSLRWVCTHWALTVDGNGRYRKSDPINFNRMQEVAGDLLLWKPPRAKTYALMV